MFAGTHAIQRKHFSLLTALLVSEKQKNHPNLPPPTVTPQANATLTPRIRAAPHWGDFSAGGEDGSQATELQVFRRPGGCVCVPFGVPPEGKRGTSGQLWGASPTCRHPRQWPPRPLPNFSFWRPGFLFLSKWFSGKLPWSLLRQFCSSWLLFGAK